MPLHERDGSPQIVRFNGQLSELLYHDDNIQGSLLVPDDEADTTATKLELTKRLLHKLKLCQRQGLKLVRTDTSLRSALDATIREARFK